MHSIVRAVNNNGNCFWFHHKFVIPSKEIHEQIKSNLKNFYLLQKVHLVVYMVQDELRNKSTGIIHNELIMQWEDELCNKFESIG